MSMQPLPVPAPKQGGSICLPNKFIQSGEKFGKFARVVYAVVLTFKGENQSCYIPIQNLAETLAIAPKTAEKYLSVLEQQQLITRAKSPGKKTLYVVPGLEFSETLANIPDNFGGVTYTPIKFLRNPGIPIAAKEFAMCILSAQNGDGYYGSYAALMKLTGIRSKQRLSKAISQAVESGCLHIQKHSVFRTNVYKFVLPPFILKMPATTTPVKPEPNPCKTGTDTPVKPEPNPCKTGTDTPVKPEPGINNIENNYNMNNIGAAAKEEGAAVGASDNDSTEAKKEKKKSSAAGAAKTDKGQNPPEKYLHTDRLPNINPDAENPLWRPFLDIYSDFIFEQTDMKIKFTGPERNALQQIIPDFIKTVTAHRAENQLNPLPDEQINLIALKSWKRMFENWHTLDKFLQKMIRLAQINQNLPNIIQQLKNGTQKGNSGDKKGYVVTPASEAARRRRLREKFEQDWD